MSIASKALPRRRMALAALVALALIATTFPTIAGLAPPVGADLSACDTGAVGGTIHRDQNTNGIADAGEVPYRPLVIDADGDGVNDNAVTINAYDEAGALVATTTSDADGDFTLTGITARVRIEFIIPAHLQSAHAGATSASAVQFADPGTCDLSYSVFEPSEYCDSDPLLAVPCYVFDDHATGAYAGTDVLVSFRASDFTVGPANILPSNSPATVADWQDAAPNQLAVNSQMGTTWGVAFNETTNVLYSAAFLKAGSDYGPGGPGAIYSTPVDPATGAATGAPTVFYTGATCDDLHGVDFNLPGEFNTAIHDNAHKCDWGDLQMSPDDSTLYAVDLLSRTVVGIDTASGAVVSSWPVPLDQDTVPDVNGNGSCTNPADDLRPFGLGWKDGLLFVGMVCTGESTMSEADTESYVYAVSPATGTYTLVANWDTNDTAITHFNSTYWDSNNRSFLSQLSLSDIVFYGDDMTVAYRDRGSDMASDINDYGWETSPKAELLCLAWDAASSSYVMEAANQCGDRPGNAAGASQNDQGEFYWGDGRNALNNPLGNDRTGSHTEIINGGLAQVNTALLYAPGTNGTDALVPRSVYTGSVISIDNETGGPVEAYGLFSGRIDATGDATGTVGKASGLGDIEALCEASPLEIGNYVWFDVDGDGVQDPDEAPVVGATVNLYDAAGNLVATTTTGPNGEYYFDVDPNTAYTIRMDNPADYAAGGVLEGWAATQVDAAPLGDGNDDSRDSDGVVGADGFPEISYTTGGAGENNHTLDFGFTAPFDLALQKQLADGTNLGTFAPGDTVTFTLTVENQGAVDATNVELVDYLPAGLTLADPAWTDNGDGTATLNTPIPALAVGATASVDISFTIDANASGPINNIAEIAGALDGDGNPATDIDSVPDTMVGNDNQPTNPNDPTDDETGESGLAGGDEDDHDIAGINVVPPDAPIFDLALIKQLADGTNLGTFAPGDTVTFTLTLENQGEADATDVAVVDYLPAGLTLADPAWTDNGDGTATLNTPIAALAAGASTTVDISFTIDANASGPINNWAEISGANDAEGNPGIDIDSTPDAMSGNDNQPTGPNDATDDETGESGLAGGDEDDHDVAGINVVPEVIVDPPPPTYSLGNQVWFDDNNNGVVDPGEAPIEGVWVELFTDTDGDGLPDDLNGDGIIDVNDAIATTGTDADGNYLFDGLEPGDYIVGIPPMEWDAGGPLEGYLSSDPTSTDPNDDIDNDDNGTPGPYGYVWSGPVTIGDGEPTGEVNDNDPNTLDANENLTVDFGFYRPVFDLALFKQLADGTNLADVVVGTDVTFTITVINQGTVAAFEPEIIEYTPVGLSLSDPDWIDNGDGTASHPLMGVTLAPGDTVSVDVTFTVGADATGTIDNWAEIASATPVDDEGNPLTYPDGSPVTDVDSVPDGSNTDTFVADDDTSGDGLNGGDEDDHDRAQITIIETDDNRLAFTGIFSGQLVGLALALMAAGSIMIIGSRRKETLVS